MMLSRIDCGRVNKMKKKASKEKLQDVPRESEVATSHLESKVLCPGDVDPAEVLNQFSSHYSANGRGSGFEKSLFIGY